MRRTIGGILAVILMTAVTACGEPAAPPAPEHGRVAIIDLDRVAKAFGRDAVMTRELEEMNKGLQAELVGLRDQLQAAITAEANKFGAAPTADQQNQLNQMRANAQVRMQEQITQAQVQANNKRAELVRAFRDEVKPFAAGAAKERGMDITIVINDSVLDYDPAVDITDGVISRMREANPAAATEAPATQPANP